MEQKEVMKVLDLFSGIGGFSLGLESTGHFKTIAFCDNDKFCKLILDKHWKGVKIYDNVKEISKEKFEEDGIEFPDIITGGFPCQPFSVAGKQQGTSDSRHLWPEMFRIIKEFSPRWVIGENVKGLTNIQDGMVFETVCSDLEGEGYEVRTFNIPAAGVQAPHRRERLWIVAHSKSERTRENNKGLWSGSSRISGGQGTSGTEDVVNPFSQYESEPIKGSNEEESRIQEEHRQKDSTTRESSRTGSVWGTNKRHEDMENSRRTLRQGSELQGENGNETKEGYANQHQRSSSTSRSNVANANSERPQGHRQEYELQKDSQEIKISGSGSHARNTDVADTSSKRLEGQLRSKLQGTREGSTNSSETMVDSSTGRCTPQETEVQPRRYSSFDSSWWQSEPELGRVAHGVSGRVHRLKALGNSIVPKIVQEIGNAIIEAEKEKDLEILDERNGM